jgi:ubiquinol-cytochrome c reductase cytochrome b subunit
MLKSLVGNVYLVNILFDTVKSYLIRYPAPKNIGYFWNFGSMSALFLIVQLLTGIFLAMFYTPHIDHAFISIEHIMNDIYYGWLIRFMHANGASFFFFFLYVHILRGVYYGSYQFPRTNVWISGVTIYFILMATAFLGYVLPWGQMSFWAATVITNLLTVIPYIGEEVVYLVWGGYAINNATLGRFFGLHFLLPFLVAFLVVIHFSVLHEVSSSNELKAKTINDTKIPFYPYFMIKDLLTMFIGILAFSIIIFYLPELFNHSINYVPADILVTPPHIVPEWYFLPFYAILRSILDKTFGIIMMFLSMVVLYMFPILDPGFGYIKIIKFIYRFFFWFFALNFLFLGFIGSQTAEHPCVELGLLCTIFHLFYSFIYLPFISTLERLCVTIKSS